MLDRWKRSTVAAIAHTANNWEMPEHRKAAAVIPPQGALTTPLAQAQQQMASFLPQKPQLAGGGVPATALDAPAAEAMKPQNQQNQQAGTATAVPGMQGTAWALVGCNPAAHPALARGFYRVAVRPFGVRVPG